MMYKLLITLVNFLVIVSQAWAYTPPIGIPDPGMWGTTHPIDSTAPATATKCPDWPSAPTTGCYYIDNTHGSATDTSNTYGYPDQPRLTIPDGTYTAGAYVEIHGGPYTSTLTITTQGTDESPVWFRGTSGELADLRGKISVYNSTYTIFEYLDFNNITGAVMPITGTASNNLCVRNSVFRDMIYPGSSSAVIGVTPAEGGDIHDIIFYHNTFHTIGDWQAEADDDYHAINPNLWGRSIPTTCYNVWVLSNTGYYVSGNLAQFNGDQRNLTTLPYFHHMYVGFNYFHHSRQDLSVTKLTTDAIISQNVVHDIFSTASGGGTGTVLQEGPNYVWIIFNKYYNMNWGVRKSNNLYDEFIDSQNFVIGNVIYNIDKNLNSWGRTNRYKQGDGFNTTSGKSDLYIIDNTIYDVANGVTLWNAVADDDYIVSGNVVAGVNGIDYYGDPETHVMQYNDIGSYAIDKCFFQPRGDNNKTIFVWAGASTTTTESLAAFQTASGQCANCAEGDPLFRYVAGYNLRPAEGSPLIGANTRHAVYDVFEARYGLSIDYDADGNQRPEGAWAIGAYEYQAGVTRKRTRIGGKTINIGGKSVEITQ